MSIPQRSLQDPELLKRQQAAFYKANPKYYSLLNENFRSGYTYEHVLKALVGRRPAPVRFLDVGSGSGYYVRSALGLGCRAIGIDVSPHAASGLGPARTVFCQADAEWIPFGDASFDVIFCQQVIEHVVFPERVLSEIARVLRPGGFLFLTAPNRIGRHTVPKLRRILRELWSGAEFKRIVPVVPDILERWRASDDIQALEDTDLCNESNIFQALRLLRRVGLVVRRFDTLRHPKKYSKVTYAFARLASLLPIAKYAGVNFKIVAQKPHDQ